MHVSVIIPAYNAAETLAETLISLQQQSFTTWEAIIVDDGSQDNTVAVAQAFADADARIRLITQPNGGVSAARNTGIAHAHYPWLLFLDSDDWIAPHHLERMTEALREDDTLSAVYSGSVYVMPDGDFLSSRTDWYEPDEVFREFTRYCGFCIHACVIRKDLVETIGGFDTSLRTCEDWDLWQRAARTGARFGVVRDELAMYRMRADSASKDGMRMLLDGLKVIARGHGVDPRVEIPDSRYANGRSIQHLSDAIYYFVNWTAGIALGQGKDASPMLEHVRGHIDPSLDPYYVAQAIFEAALQPAFETRDGWPRLWPQFIDQIETYLHALEASSRAEHLARRSLQHLARMVMQHANGPWPLKLDRMHGCVLEVTHAIPNVETAPQVERFFAHVTLEGNRLGILELPVFNGKVAQETISKAIADKFSWEILTHYLERTVYPQLQFLTESDQVNILRNGVLLAQRSPEDLRREVRPAAGSQLHHAIGWTLFLQEVWAKPWPQSAFYDHNTLETEAPTTAVAGDCIRLELTERLPDVTLDSQQLTIDVSLSGAPVGRIQLPAPDYAVRAQQIRAAISNQLGLALSRKVVQEALLGKPLAAHGTIQARLQSKAILRRSMRQKAAITIHSRQPATIFAGVAAAHGESAEGAEPRVAARQEEKAPPAKKQELGHIVNPYAQMKDAQSLALLPERPFARALEIGCAAGQLTAQLAHRVDLLQATDANAQTLARAAERCRGLENVTFAQLDLQCDPLPDEMDLIVCNESLYFLEDTEALQQVAARLSAALTDDGYLLTIHAHLIQDDSEATGFNWDLPFGGKSIARVLRNTAGITLREEVQTPLYRIQLYQKVSARLSQNQLSYHVVRYPYQPAPLPAHIAVAASWKNGEAHALPLQVTHKLPILMYHRVAPTGADALSRYRVTPEAFAAQLRYLREAGYYSVSLKQWREYAELKRPLPGKAIHLTFDDGYLDFFTYAYPLLRQYNFSATVFLVAERIGANNSWDAIYGESVPLMDWEQIKYLSRQGIRFGSHTDTHPHLTGLTPTKIMAQVERSRQTIASRLQLPVTSIAYPYGDTDEVVQHCVAAAGYSIGVTTQYGMTRFEDAPLAMPRIEVKGKDTLKEFKVKLEL